LLLDSYGKQLSCGRFFLPCSRSGPQWELQEGRAGIHGANASLQFSRNLNWSGTFQDQRFELLIFSGCPIAGPVSARSLTHSNPQKNDLAM
jgi:hypothetical protein